MTATFHQKTDVIAKAMNKQKERLENIGFVREHNLREELKDLKSEEVVYTTKVLTDQELKDENIKLSIK